MQQTYRNLNRSYVGRDDLDLNEPEDNLREALLRAQLDEARGQIKEAEDRLAQANACLLDTLTEKFALVKMVRILRGQVGKVGARR